MKPLQGSAFGFFDLAGILVGLLAKGLAWYATGRRG
jgi:hypothetical protein